MLVIVGFAGIGWLIWHTWFALLPRALAGNTHAVLQVGSASGIVPALMVQQMMNDTTAQTRGEEGNGQNGTAKT